MKLGKYIAGLCHLSWKADSTNKNTGEEDGWWEGNQVSTAIPDLTELPEGWAGQYIT